MRGFLTFYPKPKKIRLEVQFNKLWAVVCRIPADYRLWTIILAFYNPNTCLKRA